MNWLAKDILHQAIDKMMASVDRACGEAQEKNNQKCVSSFRDARYGCENGNKG